MLFLSALTPVVDLSEKTGRLRVWVPAPRLLVTHCSGRLSNTFAKALMTPFEALFEQGVRLTAFNAWFDVLSYDVKARLLLTHWVMRRKRLFDRVTLGLASPVLVMGVTLANNLLGNFMNVTTDRAHFDTYLQRAIREHQG